MTSKPLTRVLSLILVMAMMLSYLPRAYAAEEAVESEPVQIVEDVQETEAATEIAEEPAETEAAAEPATEAAEEEPVTEPTAEPATEPVAEPEETVADETVPEETVSEETVPEETVPEETVALPYGFNGMPEGYVLSEEELAAKQELIDNGTVGTVEGIVAGENYVADELIFSYEDEAYATMVAYAYNAELVECFEGTALIRLQGATVLEAVTVAADMELAMPAVWPNYITTVTPILSDSDRSDITSTFALPERQSWETWVFENLANPDPAIQDPQYEPFQWYHDVINSYEAWGVTTGDPDIIVAVIDTGIVGHADFNNVYYKDIGLGYKDDAGHGTHVTGIIGASLGNGKGGAGVAPDVTVVSIKAGGKSGFSDYYIAKAIRTAASIGADIINMSLGGAFYSSSIQSAIWDARSYGVTVLAAMGNDGTNAVNYPAACDGVIAVCATNSAGQRSYYSNYGDWADVSAPGSDIYSTYASSGSATYAYLDGTSMACPVVAGVCALYMSAVGHVSPDTMESVLEKNCNKISDKGMGAGIVDIAKMLDKVVNTPSMIVRYDSDNDGAWDDYYYAENNDVVSCDNAIDFFASVADNNDTLIYTINGKTPSIKNGQIVNGIQYHGAIALEPYAGTTVTVRAAVVTGMGNISKVMTWKLKVEECNKVTSVSLTAPKKLIAGKSVQLTASVTPEKADQSIVWSIVSDTTGGASIAANGTLKTKANTSGTVTVKAAAAANQSIYATCTISVETINPVATIKLETNKISLFAGGSQQIWISVLQDKYKNDIASNDCGLQWSSNKPAIASVNEYGYVTAHSKGTAVITCKVLDGSNKKVTCTITVKQPAEHIEITGNDTVAAGANATFKAVVYPTTASNKKVVWSLDEAPAGTTISASGAVKVPASVATGTRIKVRATSQDLSYVYTTKIVYVAPKCTGLTIGCSTSDYTNDINRFTWKNGNVTAVNLCNTDLYYGSPFARSEAQLTATVYGNGYTGVEWASSNTKVATVDQNGLVKAVGKGTANITCKVLDGSSKKMTVKVTVTVPVSQLTIKSTAPQMTSGYPCIAIGKSFKHTVVFGDTYGTPSNTKVNWSYKVFAMDSDGNSDDYTTYCTQNKLLTLNNGTLKINAAMKDKLWNDCYNNYMELVVEITATAADGSGVSDTMCYYVNPPTEKLFFTGNLYTDGDYYYLEVYSNQHNDCTWTNQRFFTATSSNPMVCSVYDVQPVYYSGGGRKWNYYYVVLAAQGAGKATVTVTAADGTNKKATYNLTVK